MNLHEKKGRRVGHICQLMLMSRDGTLKDSCHSFVSLEDHIGNDLYQQYPVLESLKPLLEKLQPLGLPLSLPAVHFSLGGRRGVYDFEFWVDDENPSQLEWLVFDQTERYNHLQRIQQQRNELLVNLQN